MTNTDRLTRVDSLVESVKNYQARFEPTIPHNYENTVKPILDAIELLAEEIRDVRA